MENLHDTAIIGAGAAGLTAGIYACRANIDTVLIEKFAPGGQAALTAFVENYPGFPDGISGFDLMENMRKQAMTFGLKTVAAEVKSINQHDSVFSIGIGSGEVYSRTIIICTGVHPRFLNVPGEKELFGKGISTCATCDGSFYRNMEIAVIGGGDSALEEGLFLTRFASVVHIIHRRDKFRALHSYVKKVMDHPKIVLHLHTVVSAINGKDTVESLSLQNVKTGEESILPVAGVFLYVGHIPNSEIFRGLLELTEEGFIKVDRNLATSVPGIFAAGDVRETPLRQIVTAASDGAVTAFSAGRYLEKLK
ncbi:MAG TPA: thioredoxin-disulfide reductase [Anaerolineae bacterium]|nr:thioredoxin-disulfide reductase [Anaerolineae bacterium]